MSITTFIFYGLVIIVFLLLYVVNKCVKNPKNSIKISNIVLLLSSYVFITYADYRFTIILILLSISTWFFGQCKKYQSIGIIVPILSLIFFKYTNFFISSFCRIFGNDFNALNIILPLGISFYTFSAISYIVDIKRNKIKPQDLLSVSLYLSFFPKLTSGPIQRFDDFYNQVNKERKIGWNNFQIGVQIYIFGLFKKIVIADRLSLFVNQVYDTPLAFSSLTVILAVFAYSLQIYFDFSGYSDMAIGISKILGIELPRNFNLPYISHNVTELWKRWHITLSSWLQDYLYISLGGNRKGKFRQYINLILTMLLGGLWHGASWTYIIWGLLHGIALVIHKLWTKITNSNERHHSILSNCISIVTTFSFTSVCWVFFRADSLNQAMLILHRIISFDVGINHIYLWLLFTLVILIISSVFAFIKSDKTGLKNNKLNNSFINGYYPILNLNSFWGLVLFFAFCGLTICLAYVGGSPFIYGAY